MSDITFEETTDENGIIRGTVRKGELFINYETTVKTVENAKANGIDVLGEVRTAAIGELQFVAQ